MTTDTNFRAALEARLADQQAAGLHGEIRANDSRFTNEVRSIQNEHVLHHADPIIASAVDRATGVPVDINGENVDPRNVIITVPTPGGGSMPMSMQAAIQMGLLKQIPDGQPAAAPGQQPAPKESEGKPDAGDTDAASTVETLRAPMFDGTDHDNLNILTDAAMRSGFSIEAVTRDLLSDNLATDSSAMVALAEASGQPVEHIAEVVQEVNSHILGQLTEMAGPELVRDAINAPGWNQAVLAGISSNSLLPMAIFMAQLYESQQVTGK